jgi:hypothetical protein
MSILIEAELINGKTFKVMSDPRRAGKSDWKSALSSYLTQKSIERVDYIVACVNEILNASYGFHEMTREHTEDVVHWFLNHKSSN